MIRSMTGYGRAQNSGGGCIVTVELRSVNHRYLDINTRLPRQYIYMEEKLKSQVQRAVSRGKVDIFVTIEQETERAAAVGYNRETAAAYIGALRQLQDEFSLGGEINIMQLARMPEVFTLDKSEPDEDELFSTVVGTLDEAIAGFMQMSSTEGENLKADILSRAEFIETAALRIESRSADTVKAYTDRLFARLSETLERLGAQPDESRILTEAAVFAEKTAVSEETVRLRSHVEQLREMLASKQAVGRKLDFLIQEFNREANTIGSKVNDIETTREVVELKSEIEKIREQVQNIE